MTTFRLSLVLLLGASGIASADIITRDMVVHTSKTPLDVKLDASTVTCTGGDLEVTAPKLAFLTLMNHNNTTLEAPALTAGVCEPGRMPQDIIDTNDPIESLEIIVKAVRRDRIDTEFQTCTTYLVERVETNIRGMTFGQEKSTWIGSRPIAQCNGADSPADDPGQVEPSTSSCATSRGGSAWVGLVLALGLVLRRRR